jgi:hypothetical protein
MHKVNLFPGRIEKYFSISIALINVKVAEKYAHSCNKSKNIPAGEL